ncbi:hypothetical protein ACWF94_09210 [Streptomyces sp. NPDC055078]
MVAKGAPTDYKAARIEYRGKTAVTENSDHFPVVFSTKTIDPGTCTALRPLARVPAVRSAQAVDPCGGVACVKDFISAGVALRPAPARTTVGTK